MNMNFKIRSRLTTALTICFAFISGCDSGHHNLPKTVGLNSLNAHIKISNVMTFADTAVTNSIMAKPVRSRESVPGNSRLKCTGHNPDEFYTTANSYIQFFL